MPADGAGPVALGALRREVRAELHVAGHSARDGDVLLGHFLNLSFAQLLARDEISLEPDVAESVRSAVRRRLAGEPLQYIVGRTEFFGRSFAVDPRVLIPRPETELLVEAALSFVNTGSKILDIGTGSGCIAVTVALEKQVHAIATDLSLDALLLARENARRLGADIRFVLGKSLAPLRGSVDLIVSNPPYIGKRDLQTLERQVRDFEPHLALSPGETGFETIDELLEGGSLLRPGGKMMLEIGYGQRGGLTDRARLRGWKCERILDDLAGIPRIAILFRDGDR